MGSFLAAVAAALWISYFVEVWPLTVPAARQLGRGDAGSVLLRPSSNLTLPPPIPGLSVRPRFDQTPRLILFQAFSNAIQMMIVYVKLPYEIYQFTECVITNEDYQEEIAFTPVYVPGQQEHHVQVMHIVQAIYETAKAAAARPITRKGYVSRMVAGLFLEDQVVGFLKWQHKEELGVSGGGTNGTLQADGPTKTGALQLVQDVQPQAAAASLNTSTEKIVFPHDPRYQLTYEVQGKDANLPDIFTAFLEALADAAPYDLEVVGAAVTTVGVSGNLALNMHGTGLVSRLSWGNIVDTLQILWEDVILLQKLREIEWELFYDGANIGAVFILVLS